MADLAGRVLNLQFYPTVGVVHPATPDDSVSTVKYTGTLFKLLMPFVDFGSQSPQFFF